jgi:outer membrane protein assembly factor BamE (lipoprotein component of BamABCDE complex)
MSPRLQRALAAAAVILAGGLAAACNPTLRTHGYRYTEGEVPEITPGEHNQASIMDMLGSPSVRGTFDENTWYYMTDTREYLSYLKPSTQARRIIAITFDGEGTVANVEEYDMGDSRQVAFVGRETPTRGRELSVLEQILGNVGRLPTEQLPGQQNLPGGAGGPRRQ